MGNARKDAIRGTVLSTPVDFQSSSVPQLTLPLRQATRNSDLEVVLALAMECLRQIILDVARGVDADEIRHRAAAALETVVAALEHTTGADTPMIADISTGTESASSLRAQSATSTHPSGNGLPGGSHGLTAREREVWRRASQGVPYAKIASKIGITVETVYSHLRNVRRKYPELKARAKSRRD